MRQTRLGAADPRGQTGRLGRVLLILVAFLVMCGTIAVGQIAVTVTITDIVDVSACSGGTGICPEPSRVGEEYAVEFEVRVTGANPDSLTPYGTATIDDGHGATWSVTFSSGTSIYGWGASCYLTSSTVGTLTITATFVPSDANFTGGSDTEQHTVVPATGVTVFVSDTPLVVNETATGTVSVYGVPENFSTSPTGTVTLTHTGNGTLTPASHTLTAADGGQFQFTYTPADAVISPHVITATYAGDSVYGGGSDTFDQAVQKRAAQVQMTVSPSVQYIGQDVMISVHVEDDTTEGAPGDLTGKTVTLTTDGTGVFDGSDPLTFDITLDGNGDGSVTYTPGAYEAGTTTLTATFVETPVYAESSTTSALTVNLRPTQTTLSFAVTDGVYVNETTSFTVTVEDTAGSTSEVVTPEGSISISPEATANGGTRAVGGPTGQSAHDFVHEWTYSYVWTYLNAEGVDYDVVTARYDANDGIHLWSEGAFGISVSRRPTTVTVSCVDTAGGLDDDFIVSVTVAEVADLHGTPAVPMGDLILLNEGDASIGSAPGPVDVAIPSNGLPIAMPTIRYTANDGVHIASVGSPATPCMREIDSGGEGDGTTGAGCTEGCGEGTVDVQAVILAMNQTDIALKGVGLGLDTAGIVVSLIPDPVWAAGIVFSSGTEIPLKEIIAAIIDGAKVLINATEMILEADLDGDGLPDVVEQTITGTSATNIDSDGDSMGDGDEIFYNSGMFGGNLRPNPTNPDSDADGILDGNESAVMYPTNVCLKDTDCDTIPDGAEVATLVEPSGDFGFNPDTWTAIAAEYPYTFPFADPRDQSDPLQTDTDGDGLSDTIEFGPGRLATSVADTNYHSYVNDDDSDDDGLQDGQEDTNENGLWDGSVATTGTFVTAGETHLCYPDTDSDGLLDGEEEGLFGQGARIASTPSGSVTTLPALDDDSDDDGLSDGEEVNVTHTDPLNWDTDGDSLSDLNELIATGGTWPQRTFSQVSDPLDPDTDDDGLPDATEYTGTGLGTSHGTGGTDDLTCTYVNDADSDNDGLQDGAEDANHDGVWSGITLGGIGTQATRSGDYWECDACNPDTDGDGLLDGEEAALLGGGPISQRPATGWPSAETPPGFDTVTPEGVSTTGPVGPDYSEGAHPLYTFAPAPGPALSATVPALDSDTDDDGLSDYEEVNTTGTDPLDGDSDNDTLADADELIATGGAWPQRTFDQESDPLDINTDDDYLFDPVEGECGDAVNPGTGLRALAGGLGGVRDTLCPYVNNADSDDDGVKDGAVIPISRQGPGMTYSYTFFEALRDVPAADIQPPGTIRIVVTPATGEQNDDALCNVCDPDSDGDGLTDGQEIGLGTDPQDWDTDDDGRSDWSEVTGGGPIPTDPFDPDTDDDGLLDSAEVFGANPTNPVNADTDGDGLCDGGAGTPYMVSGHPTVTVNPICKSCSQPGNDPCAVSVRSGSPDGIGDHPNPMGLGEDVNGNGSWDTGETDPNQFDTDGDADGDGIEVLGFSTSRQSMIPATDLFGRAITVVYPSCGCMDPLNPDTDGDGISDGMEDLNHDGNFDFATSDFDFDVMPLLGPPHPDPEETNPCDPDTDHDDLTDYQERNQPNPASEFPFNPTNPLDHDTDNDWLFDGYEVFYTCTTITYTTLDNDVDGRIDEDPLDGVDNDGDGLIDEDPVDFTVRSVPVLDPTNRDSDSDGFIDGLDEDPCNSELIPYLFPVFGEPVDSDGDGFADIDEQSAGTSEFNPDDHPVAFGQVDLDFDGCIDDRIWLEPFLVCCQPVDLARAVDIDLDNNVLLDLRLAVVARNVTRGDFDADGREDDVRYVLEYVLSNYRALQGKILATITDVDGDLVIDRVVVERK